MKIRAALATERDALAAVERASGRLFAEAGMPEIAEDEPMWLDDWERHLPTTWVAVVDGAIVGFALCEVLGGALHLEQLSVDPSHGRRGIGRALVEHVCEAAAHLGHDAVTLSTFRDVPFNMPYYERLGFTVLSPEEQTPALRARGEAEATHGLDPASRVMMRRVLRRR